VSLGLEDLLDARPDALLAALDAGHPIDPRALDDTEYRGVSLGLPSAIEKLSWKTFKKVFHRDPDTGVLRGWNVRVEQTGDLYGDYAPKTRGGAPRTFGHYHVVTPEGHRVPHGAQGLLIHYGLASRNARLDPVRRVRDPLVALEPGSAKLLLGWSYLDLGVSTVGTPSFFALLRDVPLRHVVA
jgi:hypothetical protein